MLFYRTLHGDVPIAEFEQWLYADTELERLMASDDYLELISISFKKDDSRDQLSKLLRRHIDVGAYETWKLMGVLRDAKGRDDAQAKAIAEFYDLYCRGYWFLQDLGLTFGLRVDCPRPSSTSNVAWDQLPKEERRSILEGFQPDLDNAIDRVVGWLEAKKIVLTGAQDDLGHYGFIDNRSEEEKRSAFFEQVSNDPISGVSISRNTLWDRDQDKPWWKFW